MDTKRAAFMFPALLALGLGLAGCADAHAESSPTVAPLVPVRVVSVPRLAFERPLRAIGRLGHKHSLVLSFKNGGTVRSLLVQEGALVKKGQTLALVDQTEITAQVAQARASLEKADRDRARIDRLHATAAVAQIDADDAHTATDIARATLAAALYNQSATVLVAPEDGRIDKRLVEVGEQVAPGSGVYAMSGSSAGLVLRVGVVDRELIGLTLGDSAKVTFDALPGEEMVGAISEIARVPSATSGTYEVELRLQKADPRLIAGMTAKADIARQTGPALPVVPLTALVDAGGSHAVVYALSPLGRGFTVQRVSIEVAYLADERVAVQSGLSGSERILSEGAAFVEPGRLVQPIESSEVADANR
jgi:RND family efflux transporter MFP subunit